MARPRGPQHRLLVGDNLEWLPRLPAGSADAVLTSPPYWTGRGRGLGAERDVAAYVDHLAPRLAACARALKPRGTMWLVLGDDYRQGSLRGAPWRVVEALRAEGWLVRNEVVWEKPPTAMPRTRLPQAQDRVFLLARRADHAFVPRAGMPQVLREPREHVAASLFGVLPVLLCEELLGLTTRRGDTVLDPFAGTGSVALACQRLGRRSVSIERSPAQVRAFKRRVGGEGLAIAEVSLPPSAPAGTAPGPGAARAPPGRPRARRPARRRGRPRSGA